MFQEKDKSHKIEPYISENRFYNFAGEKAEGYVLRSIAMFFQSWWHHKRSRFNPQEWFLENQQIQDKSESPKITWIGHSSFLIQIGGFNILTDPVFGSLAVVFQRIFAPGIQPDTLPKIDFVLISHNHRDHMDRKSLERLKRDHPSATFLVPQGDKYWFESRNFKKILEFNWWEKKSFTGQINQLAGIEFTFLPAFHWSGRGILDRNRSLWGSWMISCNGTNIYFAGDTAYADHFKFIKKEFPVIDIALMPIAPCEPREWMKKTHVNAEEAVQAFIDMDAQNFVPMHWGTYHFGVESFLAPIERLEKSWMEQNLTQKDKSLNILRIGEQITFPVSSSNIIQPKQPNILSL